MKLTIKALMKIQTSLDDQSSWYRCYDLEQFEEGGGTIGVYRTFQWKDKQPWEITIHPPNTDGWHLVEAHSGPDATLDFMPLLLIKIDRGALSYHLTEWPHAGYDAQGQPIDIPVYWS